MQGNYKFNSINLFVYAVRGETKTTVLPYNAYFTKKNRYCLLAFQSSIAVKQIFRDRHNEQNLYLSGLRVNTATFIVPPPPSSLGEPDKPHSLHIPVQKTRTRILVQVTIYRRLQIGRDGHPDQSEAYDIS